MTAQYEQVSIQDMREMFKVEHGWSESIIGHEYVFDYELKGRPGIKVRVWTSVSRDGNGRGKGSDAIRVAAFDAWIDKGLRKTPHIKRTKGWQGRVKERVKELIADLLIDEVLAVRKQHS